MPVILISDTILLGIVINLGELLNCMLLCTLNQACRCKPAETSIAA